MDVLIWILVMLIIVVALPYITMLLLSFYKNVAAPMVDFIIEQWCTGWADVREYFENLGEYDDDDGDETR